METTTVRLDEMHREFIGYFGNSTEITFAKPIKYRSSPHEPDMIIEKVSIADDYRNNRQLLATINQRLRYMKNTDYLSNLIDEIQQLGTDEKIAKINEVRKRLHEISPFKAEPVDCVMWIKNDDVYANDYNPNSVAPPEMELLHVSISEDGYTQPIVTMIDEEGRFQVIDGFHRHRVGKEYIDVVSRVNGYLPIVPINENRTAREDRIASTIRHNRARGKHKVQAMSDIVIELKRRFWSDEKIGRELGMDPDEVLRLTQISGLVDMFSDQEFSEAWEADILVDDEQLINE